MKFETSGGKFEQMCNMFLMHDMFPSSTVSIRKNIIFSIEKEKRGRALRFAKFNRSFFSKIEGEDESIVINIKDLLRLTKKTRMYGKIIFENDDEYISLKYGNKSIKLNYELPEEKIIKTLPFEIKNGVPYIKKEPLDVYFTVRDLELRDLADAVKDLQTVFFQFYVKNNIVYGRATTLYDDRNTIDINFGYIETVDLIEDGREIQKEINRYGSVTEEEDKLFSTFRYGLKQITEGFYDREIHIKTGINKPAWIYTGTKEYNIGILLPHVTEDYIEKYKRGEV